MHMAGCKEIEGCRIESDQKCPLSADPAFMDACDELGLFVIVNTRDGSSGMRLRNLRNGFILIYSQYSASGSESLPYGCGSRF